MRLGVSSEEDFVSEPAAVMIAISLAYEVAVAIACDLSVTGFVDPWLNFVSTDLMQWNSPAGDQLAMIWRHRMSLDAVQGSYEPMPCVRGASAESSDLLPRCSVLKKGPCRKPDLRVRFLSEKHGVMKCAMFSQILTVSSAGTIDAEPALGPRRCRPHELGYADFPRRGLELELPISERDFVEVLAPVRNFPVACAKSLCICPMLPAGSGDVGSTSAWPRNAKHVESCPLVGQGSGKPSNASSAEALPSAISPASCGSLLSLIDNTHVEQKVDKVWQAPTRGSVRPKTC